MFNLPDDSQTKPKNLIELIQYIERREIVHPTRYWYELSKLIAKYGYVPPPLILAGSIASDKKKYDRFIEQLERANDLGILEDVIDFLGECEDESDFHYSSRPIGDWEFEW